MNVLRMSLCTIKVWNRLPIGWVCEVNESNRNILLEAHFTDTMNAIQSLRADLIKENLNYIGKEFGGRTRGGGKTYKGEKDG